jgi:hypothetical protein
MGKSLEKKVESEDRCPFLRVEIEYPTKPLSDNTLTDISFKVRYSCEANGKNEVFGVNPWGDLCIGKYTKCELYQKAQNKEK